VPARRAAAQRVSGQDGAQACLADDQDPAGQFAARPGRALADRVRLGRLLRTLRDPQAAGPDDGADCSANWLPRGDLARFAFLPAGRARGVSCPSV
jgi:hypothetical protein